MKRSSTVALSRLVALLSLLSAVQGTNTNVCLGTLPILTQCAAGPTQGCCGGVKTLVENLCDCNPAVLAYLANDADNFFVTLQGACRTIFPADWTSVPANPRGEPTNCTSTVTFNYQCPIPDLAVDGLRLATLFRYSDTIEAQRNLDSPLGQCFDVERLAEGLSTAFYDDTIMEVPYGIGTYVGPRDIGEYVAISFQSLNHDFWRIEDQTSVPPTVDDDGSVWRNVIVWPSQFFRGGLTTTVTLGQNVFFDGCETERISRIFINGDEGARDFFSTSVWTSQHSKRWGLEDICRVHTAFCAPNKHTRQYESEQECLDFMRSLPLYSDGCGSQRPLLGLSMPCKWKHHFMIPANPELHCPHIGPAGTLDPNGAAKCDDAYECSELTPGMESWPTMDVNTVPAEILTAIEASNVGFEDEPLGCAIRPPPECPDQCGFRFSNPDMPTFDLQANAGEVVVLNDGNPIVTKNGSNATGCWGWRSTYWDAYNGVWSSNWIDANGWPQSRITQFIVNPSSGQLIRHLKPRELTLAQQLEGKIIRTEVTCFNGANSCVLFAINSGSSATESVCKL